MSDASDGHLVHLYGLNFSRAWNIYSLVIKISATSTAMERPDMRYAFKQIRWITVLQFFNINGFYVLRCKCIKRSHVFTILRILKEILRLILHRDNLLRLADKHVMASMGQVLDSEYSGSHWLATFLSYALIRREEALHSLSNLDMWTLLNT